MVVRSRKSVLAMVLIASVTLPVTVVGQGVPIGDFKRIALEVLGLREEAAKTAEMQDKNQERLRQVEARVDQLTAAQQTLDLLTETSRFVPGLEGAGVSGGGAFMGAAEIYPIEDNNPYAARIMGDAPVTIEQMIADTAQKHAGHPALAHAGISAVEFRCWLQALVKQESNFSIGAKSHVGAFGLTQIMPGTFTELGIPDDGSRQDPRVQLDGGARYLLKGLGMFGSMPLALAAYNAGPGAVQKYNGIPPYKETQNYVVKITGYYNRYAARMGGNAAAVGTLDPRDMVIADASNLSDAAMGYAAVSMNTMHGSMTRLRQILMQVEDTGSVKNAMDLNTYARAEVARMAVILARLQAVQRKVEAARTALTLEAYARDEEYLRVRLDG
ncbi:transglycosylase SLT domain-containing protein [Paracoccus sp. YIM 132242]|uniref:Transglycosylase SLT domain-containing protein n=1 Tax=Paracoccus lichenicola TaxID=2665644 RepID=A0A6L6HTJ4_9RHOB|nr:lytic transglycosylase domain-containing protein [Paracoccus lichenicola]MTE01699.1 transglycosylase SLT domain-containing protein [Paracoccus lichenicola]